MNAILSVVKNGRVEVDAPPDWPDGAPVRVELGLNLKATDEERPETPEEIEEWIRWFREIEPIEMTPEEEASWAADLKAQKEFDIAPERDRRIEGIFECGDKTVVTKDGDLSAVPGLPVEKWATE